MTKSRRIHEVRSFFLFEKRKCLGSVGVLFFNYLNLVKKILTFQNRYSKMCDYLDVYRLSF